MILDFQEFPNYFWQISFKRMATYFEESAIFHCRGPCQRTGSWMRTAMQASRSAAVSARIQSAPLPMNFSVSRTSSSLARRRSLRAACHSGKFDNNSPNCGQRLMYQAKKRRLCTSFQRSPSSVHHSLWVCMSF